MFTREIQALQGIATVIIYDGKVDDSEIGLLSEWVTKNLEFADVWPISELYDILNSILEDGVVTPDERKLLFSVLDKIANSVVEDGKSSPTLCDPNPTIAFEGRSFLITGRLQIGKRRAAQEKIESLGGVVKLAPTRALDYLVIGELGTEQWTYSRYGRKIETVMQNRSRGCRTQIVSERDFVYAMISAKVPASRDGTRRSATSRADSDSLTSSRKAKGALKGKKIVIAGTLEGYTRAEAQALVKQHGGKATSSVSKKTDYVLAGANPGSKLAKAEKLGVPVIELAEFLKMIGEMNVRAEQ